jgi:alpha-1,3-mannosyltransferase
MAVKSLQKNVPWHLQRKKKPKSLKDLTESLTEWTCKLFLSVCSPKSSKRFSHLLLMVELVLCSYIVKNVAYTEIDWQAYMEEVEGFLNGTLDYSKLQGATGPLVYPAGFVYIFSGLYHLTDGGKDVGLAQAIFTAFYLMTLVLVFRLYVASQRMPPYLFILICLLSYRIHSIFLLRLFNDCIAMLLFFASANLLVANRWLTGCLLFRSV